MKRSPLWPILGALVCGGIAFAIAWQIGQEEVGKAGDYRAGAARFIGMVSAIGVAVGYVGVSLLTRGRKLSRDGFTLVYKRIEPMAAGYRSLVTVTVGDLLKALREVGYDPRAEACDEVGERLRKPADDSSPIAGTNVAFIDSKVQGYIRLQLPVPAEGTARAMGLVEIWSPGGGGAEEFALFLLRVLDGLVGNLSAARESSRLSEDPVSMLTAGLAPKPRFRTA